MLQGVFVVAALLAAFFLLGVSAWWLTRHASDPIIQAMAIGFLGGLAGLIVANCFTVCVEAPEVVGYFWILAGLIVRAVWLERTKQTA